MRRSFFVRGWLSSSRAPLIVAVSALSISATVLADEPAAQEPQDAEEKRPERTSRISDEAIPLIDVETFPQRPKPLIELGNPFLGSGNIAPGIEMPGGSVWQPSLLVYGTYRTAVQAFHNGDSTVSEWANRLDVFGNLQLTGTERILVGFRPLDNPEIRGPARRYTGYSIRPDDEGESGFQDTFDGEITTLFFEGDLGEMLPALDPYDSRQMDIGFAVGRQPISLQDGMLINDTLDSIGITRNSILPPGGTNLQLTFLYSWNQIHRDDNLEMEEKDVDLFAASAIADYPFSTMTFDAVYVRDDSETQSDGLFWGAGGVQRIGHFNTTFRVLGSQAMHGETAAVSNGHLLFTEVSWTPPWSEDLIYINGFWGIDEFSSAARGPETGGPLGRTGILFAAVGLGRYGAPLGNRADNSYGGAIGYQIFLDETRKQIIFEFGGRESTIADGDSAIAAGARYQQAIGQHMVLQLDIFGTLQESRDDAYGGRVELRYEF